MATSDCRPEGRDGDVSDPFVRSFIKHILELGASVLGPGEQWGTLTPCGGSPRSQNVLGAAPGPTYRLRTCCVTPDRLLCLSEPQFLMGNAGKLLF